MTKPTHNGNGVWALVLVLLTLATTIGIWVASSLGAQRERTSAIEAVLPEMQNSLTRLTVLPEQVGRLEAKVDMLLERTK